MRTIKTYRKVGAFYIACDQPIYRHLLINVPCTPTVELLPRGRYRSFVPHVGPVVRQTVSIEDRPRVASFMVAPFKAVKVPESTPPVYRHPIQCDPASATVCKEHPRGAIHIDCDCAGTNDLAVVDQHAVAIDQAAEQAVDFPWRCL